MSDRLRNGLALAAVFGAALALRLWDLRQPFAGDYAWNEAYYARIARGFAEHGFLAQLDVPLDDPTLATPLVPWLVHLSFRAFGIGEAAARLPMLLSALLSLGAFYLFTRARLGSRTALVASLLTATTPGLVFYSRNLQLDGVMTTFGLAALLALDRYRRTDRPPWAWGACLLFSLAIFAKFTGVLFWPALTWIFFAGESWRQRRRWMMWILFTAIAVLPSILWSAYALAHAPQVPATPDGGVLAYLERFREWRPENFAAALRTLWPGLLRHFGTIGLSVVLLLGIPALLRPGAGSALRPYVVFALLILPWYAQLAYPRSWTANPYYIYPALYGLCALAAALALAAYDRVVQAYGLTGRRRALVAGLWIAVVVFANLWDYRDSFHGAYHPWAVVRQPERFYSAKRVAALNPGKAPVLTDVLMTLYYTEGAPGHSAYRWWKGDEQPMIDAVRGRTYEFIAVEYAPSIDILKAIDDAGYEQIAPGAWRRAPSP